MRHTSLYCKLRGKPCRSWVPVSAQMLHLLSDVHFSLIQHADLSWKIYLAYSKQSVLRFAWQKMKFFQLSRYRSMTERKKSFIICSIDEWNVWRDVLEWSSLVSVSKFSRDGSCAEEDEECDHSQYLHLAFSCKFSNYLKMATNRCSQSEDLIFPLVL